jgi:hypothetical protein
VLEQDELHVLLGELGLVQGAHQEDVRISAAGDGDALALQSSTFWIGVSLRVTSAVHSGRE